MVRRRSTPPSPPANLPYSVVCVFPAAEAGRSLRILTLFGAEWCCCLEYLEDESRGAWQGYGDTTQRPTAVGFATAALAAIVQTNIFDDFPESFVDILQSKQILKVGASFAGDVAKLKQHFGVDVQG
eukprot:COSAG05_NODE_1514_length_4665_cov_54.657687_4_plen_127_part_00